VRAWPLALGVAWTAAISAPASAAEPTKKECVAANEGGQDLRQGGKLREARAALAVCMSPRCPRPVREDCAQRLADIEAALPTLVFVAKDGDGNDLRDVRVSMDGQDLAASDGNAVAVDPGDRAFTFTKEGFPPATSDVVVHEGDKNRRIQVVLGAPKPAASETTTASPEPHVAATAGTETKGLFGLAPAAQRGIGLGVGIAGVVLTGTSCGVAGTLSAYARVANRTSASEASFTSRRPARARTFGTSASPARHRDNPANARHPASSLPPHSRRWLRPCRRAANPCCGRTAALSV